MLRMLRRGVQIGACAAVLVACLRPAHSAPAACVVAWRNGDNLVTAGQLRAAKISMLKCAHASCGSKLSKECSRRVVEIEMDIPTVVPVVKSESGEPMAEVSMAMDGEVVASRLDGRAIMVDPGSHEFTFQSGRRVLARYKTVILQGQRNRTVEVTLRSGGDSLVKTRVPPSGLVAAAMAQQASKKGGAPELSFVPDEEETTGRHFTTGTVALASLGVLGIGGFSLGNYLGNREDNKLTDCLPNCPPARLSRVDNFYTAAKISLGLGIVAVAGAAYLYFTSDSDSDSEESDDMALNQRRGYRFDLLPTAAGGYAAFSGSF